MNNGIFTIPLSGCTSAADGPPAAPRPTEFVAGPENQLAATALQKYLAGAPTARQPEGDFATLVFYGPHGSGKSHLAQGLADWWRRQRPGDNVICLAGSELAESYVRALDHDSLATVREQLQTADLLVVDDLNQLHGKPAAQRELIWALDALVDREALAVVTARWLPTYARQLAAGLRSRLSSGLAIPLALPGPQARRAILQRVADSRGVELSQRVIAGLAGRLGANVPALVAAVLELELTAQARGRGAGDQPLEALVAARQAERRPSVREVAAITAKYFGLRVADLKSPRRSQPLVAGRRMAMYLSRQLTGRSFEQIGAYFGGRDHTTVIHGCRRTEKLISHDPATRQTVAELKKQLAAG